MQKVRMLLRGRAVILMGKNTVMRKVMKELISAGNTKLQALLNLLKGNIGLVFTNHDLKKVRDELYSNKVPAAAKVGTEAQSDVFVKAGPTGLDPGQTNFFQALHIGTKISKGAIEIINDVHLIKKGEKVTPSHVSLLSKLNIKPFHYGFGVLHIFEDGNVYGPNVLDMTEDELMKKFFNGVKYLAALGLRLNQPSLATLPHSFAHALKKLIALAVVTEIDFKEAKQVKEYLKDPSKFASAAPTTSAPAKTADKAAPKKEEKKKEEKKEEEEDGDMGFSLFD